MANELSMKIVVLQAHHFPPILMIFNTGAILALASFGSVAAYPKPQTTTTPVATAASTTTKAATPLMTHYGFVRSSFSIQATHV